MIKILIHMEKGGCVMFSRVIHIRFAVGLLLLVLAGALCLGCGSTIKERNGDPAKGIESASGKYYFFSDVLIPNELKYKPKKSFVYETPEFKTGSLVFSKFWVESGSLVDFFIYHMEKDNWKLLNSYRGKESILNFSKPEKACAIKIVDRWYGTTEVEVRIGPIGVKRM
jgi:hypothetical protein